MLLEWIIDEYKFFATDFGTVMVFKNNMYISSFNVHEGIDSVDRMKEEAENYYKFIKQKY